MKNRTDRQAAYTTARKLVSQWDELGPDELTLIAKTCAENARDLSLPQTTRPIWRALAGLARKLARS